MSASPMRLPAGFTQDTAFQPLGLLGVPNPFFYAQYHDDFIGYLPGRYTNTITSSGSIAQTPGANGRLLFTTNTSTPLATDIASQQLDAAAFSLTSTKKFAYLTRLQVADITNPALLVGVIQTTTTPFTPTDGIFFSKASGSTNLVVNVMASSVVLATATLPGLLTANTDIDLGFVYDGRGSVRVFAGTGLIGQVLNQNTANLGPVARLTPTTLPTALLNPTLAIQSGTATSKTMNVDLQFAAMER